MNIMDSFLGILIILLGFAIGATAVFELKQDKAQYATNLAKFEIMYEKCMGHKKSTVSECQKLAEFKSKTLVSGDSK